MEDEIEFIMTKVGTTEIQGISAAFGSIDDINLDSLTSLRQTFKDLKVGADSGFLKAQGEKMRLRAEAEEKARQLKLANAPKPFSDTEQKALMKAVKKYVSLARSEATSRLNTCRGNHTAYSITP